MTELVDWRGHVESSVHCSAHIGLFVMKIMEQRLSSFVFHREGHVHLCRGYFEPRQPLPMTHRRNVCSTNCSLWEIEAKVIKNRQSEVSPVSVKRN